MKFAIPVVLVLAMIFAGCGEKAQEKLAEKMIDVLAPQKRIDIEFIGIRAGEKIKEQLWAASETPIPTPHKDILGLLSPASFSRTEMDDRLAYMTALANAREADLLKKALFETDFVAEAS